MELVFENARYLWLLLLVPFVIFTHFFFLHYTKRRALRFANFRALKRITGKNLVTRNYFLLILRVLIVTLVALAASGTVVWYEGLSSDNDFVIALDTSSSMSAQDIVPTRLEAAKENARMFVDVLEARTRIGVLTFSGVALIQLTPTEDKDRVHEAIERLDILQAGGTDIPGAIITGVNLLLDNERGRSIILITDGSNTIESFLDHSLNRALEYANEYRVRIHTIGIGGDEENPIGYLPEFYNVSASFNEENLLLIANRTGGTYTHAESPEEVVLAFQRIADDSTRQLLRFDLASLFVTIAVLLIFVEWILSNTRYRVLP